MSIASRTLDFVSGMHNVSRRWERDELESHFGPGLDDETAAVIDDMLMGMLRPACTSTASKVWVSPEMTDLLTHAAQTLPPFAYEPSVPPWPNAVVVFGKPVLHLDAPIVEGHPTRVDGIQWTTDYEWAGEGSTQKLDHMCCYSLLSVRDGGAWPITGGFVNRGVIPASDNNSAPNPIVDMDRLGRVMCALWLLVKQRVALRSGRHADRSAARRWERLEVGPPPEVTVVTLRRPVAQANDDAGPGFVEWSHRWIVDGHWRNQYHPSTQTHVPTWIAPYVKGPDDKPLVVKDKIHAWVR